MLTPNLITDAVTRALAEDTPWGDTTVAASIPAQLNFDANLVARQVGCFAGGAILAETFRQVDPRITVSALVADGTNFAAGDVLFTSFNFDAGEAAAEVAL